MKLPLFVERALFVVAPRHSGKSTQLRSMFRDARFGTKGAIPPSSKSRKLPETYALSNDRYLYLRLTSPHEVGETPKRFIKKTRDRMDSGRWCFACPFHPGAFWRMPDVVECVRLFAKAMKPERVRVVFLSPNCDGTKWLEEYLPGRNLPTELLHIRDVEVVCIDAQHKEAYGLFLADFFDYT